MYKWVFLNILYKKKVLELINKFYFSCFPGLYGTLFRRNKEAAFSNYRLWESAGFVVAYAYSTHLCARMKLKVMFTVLVIGVIGYIIVEILHKRKVSSTHSSNIYIFLFNSSLKIYLDYFSVNVGCF